LRRKDLAVVADVPALLSSSKLIEIVEFVKSSIAARRKRRGFGR
jgi:hypothetical protein